MLPENLKRIRERHKLTQKELADRIGVQHTRISEIELGKSNPRLSTIEKIAAYFGIPVARLLQEPRNRPLRPKVRGKDYKPKKK